MVEQLDLDALERYATDLKRGGPEHVAGMVISDLIAALRDVHVQVVEYQDHLDMCIRHWRRRRDDPNDEMQSFAHYYVDAFQSARVSLFGETLPVEQEGTDHDG